ncbi:20588_t:CDS:2 [Gigaspora margarita]|uniref:20588_t:CDS:1 n=1 Tax=Gigaspora margarita TaxID=4874 RepID=A0ABN7UUI1_GIGMA|nr:20588_t:CDS:2 [Gigaspora margarita]
MEIILVSQKLFEKKDQKIKDFLREYSNRKAIEVYNWINYKKSCNKPVTINEEIFALGVEQEPSKNNESKVRQKILLETEYEIEDYGMKEIEIPLTKIEDSSLEENNYPLEIFDKVLDQVPEKLKEDIVLRKETNRENN